MLIYKSSCFIKQQCKSQIQQTTKNVYVIVRNTTMLRYNTENFNYCRSTNMLCYNSEEFFCYYFIGCNSVTDRITPFDVFIIFFILHYYCKILRFFTLYIAMCYIFM